MRRAFTRLAVVLSCLALSVAATKVTNSFREQDTAPQVISPTPIPQPFLASTSSIVREEPSAPESLSPYAICNFIDGEKYLDLRTLWQLLNIEAASISRSQHSDPSESSQMATCSDCRAEIFQYELNGQPGNEILLKISDGIGRSTRYLLFSSSDASRWGEWKLLGHIDSENDKYRMSQHKVFMGGRRNWLVISSQGASGSGVASFYDRVFLVIGSRVHKVLGYVSEGHEGGGSSEDSREFFGQLVSVEVEGDLVTAEVAMVVQYFGADYLGGGDGSLLWEKSQKAFFTSRLGQSKQILDVRKSTLSERELEEVYNIDSLTEEGYFEYNAKELSHIAAGKEASKREWLRRFLDVGEETPGTRHLRQLLAK